MKAEELEKMPIPSDLHTPEGVFTVIGFKSLITESDGAVGIYKLTNSHGLTRYLKASQLMGDDCWIVNHHDLSLTLNRLRVLIMHDNSLLEIVKRSVRDMELEVQKLGGILKKADDSA